MAAQDAFVVRDRCALHSPCRCGGTADGQPAQQDATRLSRVRRCCDVRQRVHLRSLPQSRPAAARWETRCIQCGGGDMGAAVRLRWDFVGTHHAVVALVVQHGLDAPAEAGRCGQWSHDLCSRCAREGRCSAEGRPQCREGPDGRTVRSPPWLPGMDRLGHRARCVQSQRNHFLHVHAGFGGLRAQVAQEPHLWLSRVVSYVGALRPFALDAF
mmetsp:Transcript_14715/g.37392  ORF Transcript_14715/g.37392 Transcript_14715/m.37392 type:complete len:213 (+) Transcript_14715:207-845(+)